MKKARHMGQLFNVGMMRQHQLIKGGRMADLAWGLITKFYGATHDFTLMD